MTNSVPPWDQEGYGDVVGVKTSLGVIDVEFANGDVVEVSVPELGLDGTTTFVVDPEAATLIAETPGGSREIDWMVIRAISDPAFAREIRARDAEEARRVGRRLRSLRERRGLSQKDVAKSLGMKAPQLAKIERGEQDLRLSTLRSVLRILGATFNDIAGPDVPELSLEELATTVDAPEDLLRTIAKRVRDPQGVPAQIARAFKWDLDGVLAGSPESPPLGIQVAFAAVRESHRRPSAVERLARTISEISVAAADPVQAGVLPREASDLRDAVLGDDAEQITLESLLRWTWDQGIVVVPMASGPGFQAAAWYVEERPVIVLRLRNDFSAQWLFTLAHEIGHLVLGHVGTDSARVEITEPGKVADDDQEDAANTFAKSLLAPDSEALFAEIRRRTPGSIDDQRHAYKGNMEAVAGEAGLDTALLGFLAAFAMKDVARGTDRWGSAVNIAKDKPSGRSPTRDAYLGHVDLDRLDPADSDLIEAVVLE
jgi:transcriptional regulator with XRE-family HTH domain